MKKMTLFIAACVSSMAFTSMAFAVTPGAYMGIGLGESTLRTPNFNDFPSLSHKHGGLGGRVFGGYNVNENFGMELGYARYARSLYQFNGFSSNASLKFSDSAIFAVGKGYLPLGNNGFHAYALGGLARVNNKISFRDSDGTSGSKTFHAVRPMYGVGVNYEMKSITTSLELSRIQGKGNMKANAETAIPNADMLSLNVAYNFS